ncbi:MAG TPA: Sec-independent protein translocase protein TatB [Methyloversatilis sp.]
MFDIGFSELFVIGIVALIVLGPERLPRVARTAGHLLGRLQRYVNDVKSDISREMQLEELRKLQSQVEQQVREVGNEAGAVTAQVSGEVTGLSDQMRAAMAEQEKYAAIENATEPALPETAPAVVPEPLSGQLSLDISEPVVVRPTGPDKA